MVTSSAAREPAAGGSMVAVRRVIVMGGAPRGRRMRRRGVRVMVVSVPRAAARMALPRAGERDDRRDDAAEQREKDDRLIHGA